MVYTPDKLEKHRSRVTVGSDRLTVLINCSAPTVDLPTIKCLWNSVMSTLGAKYFTMDVSKFYLSSPMEHPEFMRMPIKIIPQKIIDQCNLLDIDDDGWVYIRIKKGMYGLPQAGKLTNNLLVERLRTAGYKWDYNARTLDTSVPGFVKKALIKYQHPMPAKPQHAPAKAAPINYGARVQHKTPEDNLPPLSEAGIKRIQDVVRTLVGTIKPRTQPWPKPSVQSRAARRKQQNN